MNRDMAVRLALEYVREHPEWEVAESPTTRLIPARYRPDPKATTDAWAVSFPYSRQEGRLPHHSPLVVLVDVTTDEVSVPMML